MGIFEFPKFKNLCDLQTKKFTAYFFLVGLWVIKGRWCIIISCVLCIRGVVPQIDLLNTRPVIPLNKGSFSYRQFGFLLVKIDIYRTRRQSLHIRIQPEKSSSLDSKNMEEIPG